jgi:subtilisin family serine protease
MVLALLDDPPAGPEPELPVVLQIDPLSPGADESWTHFKDRVGGRLGRQTDLLRHRIGVGDVRELFAGNALAATLTAEQVTAVSEDPDIAIAFAELDPLLPVVLMNDVVGEVGAATFRTAGGGPAGAGLTGAGVTVAVLDTGVDRRHPALTVAHSVETCGESVDVPGGHGTHCAGIIASSDPVAPGIAPGVDLIDVKVLRANGTGRHTAFTAGVDRALDLSADILSISLGFNHLPVTVAGGHGWTCADGACPLCTAVDNAVLEGALVVVAAGNEHQRCEGVRAAGQGLAYDTELGCPGQARGALTVGAVHKATHAPAAFSSNGPTAYDMAKPDLVAPGVDVRSTIPRPRHATGRAVARVPPLLFGVRSGTSAAAPVVAGACALLIESARRTGAPDDPGSIRRRLLDTCVERIGGPANVVGAGRLRLS